MSSDYTPTVRTLTWFWFVAAVLGVATRGLTKAIIVRSLNVDDFLIAVSLLFALGQSITVSLGAGHGYGELSTTPDQSQLANILKSEYAAALLYIASLCFAKISVLALVKSISPIQRDRLAAYGITAFIILWAITAEFATAFICKLPTPWDYTKGQCRDRRHTWWNYFEATNIVTDFALILLPLIIIWNIRLPLSRKASVFSFFAFRSTVIAASACKLVFWNRYQRTQSPGLDPWTVTICTQIIQGLSIITACFLYLKPFLDSVESGFLRSDDIRRRGTSDYYGHSTGDSSANKSGYSLRKHHRIPSDSIRLNEISNGRNATTITAGEPVDTGDIESQHSRTHIIKQTKTFTVEDGSRRESEV